MKALKCLLGAESLKCTAKYIFIYTILPKLLGHPLLMYRFDYFSHWCLVMSFWLKVCIYSHTRGVKLGLGLGFMQTSQVLPHWLNQSFSFWTLSYTQRHCHVRIEKSPNCYYNIRSTQFPRISLYALTLRFVLIEITKVVKPVH